jgi:RNA polymerase sigma factor (sigma-70 family)
LEAPDQQSLVNLLADTAPGPETLAEQQETQLILWNALGRLTPAEREAVVLHYYLGLTETEIAQQTTRARGTVKWLLHSARERLRRVLAPVRS